MNGYDKRILSLLLLALAPVAGSAQDPETLHRNGSVLEAPDNLRAVAGTLANGGPPAWPTPATLSVTRCIDDSPPPPPPPPQPPGEFGPRLPRFNEPGMCGRKPVFNQINVGFQTDGIERAAIAPSGKIRFGPFKLKRSAIGKAENTSDVYTIEILARSPAVFGKNADGETVFLGADASLKRVGFLSEKLTGSAEKEVFVDAILTSVFSALKIVVGVGGKKAAFPAGCSDLPPSATAPQSFDAACLQATINPLAMLNLRWVPLTIIYEPPGNCSWSNLTDQHTAGVTVAAQRQSSNSSRLVSDSGFFWDVEHSDFTNENVTGTQRGSSIHVGRSTSMGTRLGLPLNNPGNPRCNDPSADVPLLPTQGPGEGEIFVLLKNANMIYWDTEGFHGSTLSPVPAPGLSEQIFFVSAHAIRTGEGLPAGASFSAEEQEAILSLSPFSLDDQGELVMSLDPGRFLPIGPPIGLQRGLAQEHSLSRQMTVSGSKTLTETIKSESEETESDLAVDLAFAGLQIASSAAVSGGATKALELIKTSNKEPFDKAADKIEVSLPTLFTDKTTTTTTVTFSSTRFVERVEDSAVTQQFFIQDTNQGLNVSILYDRLFGTYVFVPLVEGAGFATEVQLQNLPTIVWKLDEPAGPEQEIPEKIQSRLAELGATALEAAGAGTFRVVAGNQRLPIASSLRRTSIGWPPLTLPAARSAGGPAQGLLIAEDDQGRPVGQVWVSAPD